MPKIAVIFVGISLLAAVPCSAAIITVDPNGSADYTTIQAAINAAVSGADTVIVAEGTYIENISFGGKNIVLMSIDPNDPAVVAATIIDGGNVNSVVTFGGTETSDCVLAGFTIRNGQRGKPLSVDIQAENGDVESGWIEWSAPSGQEPGTIDLKAYFDDDFSAYMDWGQCLDNGDWQTDYPPAPWLADVLEDGYKEDECCAALIFSNLEAGNYEILTYHCDMMHPGPSPKTTFDIEIEGEIVVDDAEVVGNYISHPEQAAVYFEFSSDGIHEVEIWFDYFALAEEFWLNGFELRALAAERKGGGIAGNGCSATITKCVITDNQATYGAGLDDCDGLIQDNIICDNEAIRIHMEPEVVGGNHDGGGLYECDGVIEKNIITRNYAYAGAGLRNCNGIIRDNVISDNHGLYGAAATSCNGSFLNNLVVGNREVMGGTIGSCNGIIRNCTIVGNKNWGLGDCYGTISNCIIWRNAEGAEGDQLEDCSTPSYSCIQNWLSGGVGNISTDPCFVSMGDWFSYEWIDTGGDYHLKSQAGRWDPNTESRVLDSVTSPCIDTGNPGCPLGDEPVDPNNVRINMGAYGGTWQASRTPPGWALLADLTNDGFIDYRDLASHTQYWQQSADCQPGDLNRNGIVDLPDIALLAYDWLLSTTWH